MGSHIAFARANGQRGAVAGRTTQTKPPAGRKASAKAAYPFPYFGEGSVRPIRPRDGLMVLVVFPGTVAAATAKAIAASAPEPLRRVVKTGKRWISLASSAALAADAKAWARASGASPASPSAALAHLGAALSSWIREVHASHPVGLLMVGSDGKHGPWHAWSVGRYAELVRPLVDALRRDGEDAHADWIARSFLRESASTQAADLRGLAESDPKGKVGDIGKRCLLALPMVDAGGPAVLADAGPYAELGFWACASIHEYVPDLAAHAEHLIALARACPPKRRGAVPQLLVRAGVSMMRDGVPMMARIARPARTPTPTPASLEAALRLAHEAVSHGPLTVGLLELLVDEARALGGASGALKMAKPFLRDALATSRASRDAEERARVASFSEALRTDLAASPDADVARTLAG